MSVNLAAVEQLIIQCNITNIECDLIYMSVGVEFVYVLICVNMIDHSIQVICSFTPFQHMLQGNNCKSLHWSYKLGQW